MIDYLLLNIQQHIFLCIFKMRIGYRISKHYTEMREECDNKDNNFWLLLEKYGELNWGKFAFCNGYNVPNSTHFEIYKSGLHAPEHGTLQTHYPTIGHSLWTLWIMEEYCKSPLTPTIIFIYYTSKQGKCKAWHIPSPKNLTFDLENQ